MLHYIEKNNYRQYYFHNKEIMLDSFKDPFFKRVKIIKEYKDKIIIELDNFNDFRNIFGFGIVGWCLTRQEDYFDHYVKKDGNKSYVILDFSLNHPNDDESIIGIIVNKDNELILAKSVRNYNLTTKIKEIFENKKLDDLNDIYSSIKIIENFH